MLTYCFIQCALPEFVVCKRKPFETFTFYFFACDVKEAYLLSWEGGEFRCTIDDSKPSVVSVDFRYDSELSDIMGE